MLFKFSVPLRCPSPWKCTKRHSKLRRSTATTSMTRWSFPLHWKLDARPSIPKTFTTARQLMDSSPLEIPSLDHPADNLHAYLRVMGGCTVGRKKISGFAVLQGSHGQPSVVLTIVKWAVVWGLFGAAMGAAPKLFPNWPPGNIQCAAIDHCCQPPPRA